MELVPTGERTAPGLPREEYWFARHEVAYRWIADHVIPGREGVVIDAGAGEGYGAAILAETGPVIALEYDESACRHLHRTYRGVTAVRANLDGLPLTASSANAVVCLQVIEHLWSLRAFLSECRRVLRPEGLLVVSTPNRPVFSPGLGRGERPTNPFHVEEFDAEQVAERLATAGFADVQVYGVHHGRRIQEWESAHGSIVQAQVDAVLGGMWPAQVEDFVSSVTAEDFAIVGTTEGAHDIICVGRAA